MNEHVQSIVERLRLTPHPEGGFYREIYRSRLEVAHGGLPADQRSDRPSGTSIYFLLPATDFSAFHRVRWTDEQWHFYSGDAIELHLIHQDGRYEKRVLTADLERGEPTTTVEAGCWQAARIVPGGAWGLAGCSVAPGFDFSDFDMPPAAAIVAAHPEHERIIRELTKR